MCRRLGDRRSHGEDAGIAGGHHDHAGAACREIERELRTLGLDAIVAGVHPLARSRCDASEIRAVADKVCRSCQFGTNLWCRLRWCAGSESDDDNLACT